MRHTKNVKKNESVQADHNIHTPGCSCQPSLHRREFLKKGYALGLTSLGVSTAFAPIQHIMSSSQAFGASPAPRYLFTICTTGGASVVDSFLAQASGPVAYANLTKPGNGVFSAVPVLQNSIQGAIPLGNGYPSATFITKHGSDMVVMTSEVSSVNHLIAAKRAMTGDNVFGGKTIAEALAMAYGEKYPLANLLLAGGGYGAEGDDRLLPGFARGQAVADPLMFAFATHGFKGLNQPLSKEDINALRLLRSQVESAAPITALGAKSPIVQSYLENRNRVVSMLENGDTITKMMLRDPATSNLQAYGLQISQDFELVRSKFTNLASDAFEARLALGFLAVKNKLSVAVTIAPNQAPLISAQGTPNAPIAFDWSHVDHRGAQNSMWSYVLKGTDSLIDLLKATDDPNANDGSKMWDRSVIYLATEFGRDKVATGGSGHHLNNGVVMISPLLNGGKIFGGVDPATGLTFGFDGKTGEASRNLWMNEKDIFSALSLALGIKFQGQKDLSSMVKKSAV
jgi:hypothetical protein